MTRIGAGVWGACLFLTALVATPMGACSGRHSPGPDTGVIVVVRSDLVPEVELDRLTVETHRDGGERRSATIGIVRADAGPGDTTLPMSFVVYASERDMMQGVRLRVTGYAPEGEAPRVRRVVHLPFVRGRILRLVLDLTRACQDQFVACEMQQKTCTGDGMCIETAVDGSDLEQVEPGDELDGLPIFDARGLRVPGIDAADGGAGRRDASFERGPLPSKGKMPSGPPQPSDSGPEGRPDAGSEERSMTVPGCEAGVWQCLDRGLWVCADGSLEHVENCEFGCDDGEPVCHACAEGEVLCKDGRWDVCRDGARTVIDCPRGCDPGAPHCAGCTGSPDYCTASGTLQKCMDDGGWARSVCFAGCTGGPDEALAGVTALSWQGEAARCEPCTEGAVVCDGQHFVACGMGGTALPDANCYFGCDPGSRSQVCRENTPIGQALIHLIVG